VLSTRKAPRSSTVHLRALVAATLALGLVLALAASAAAAPDVTIDPGPASPMSDPSPVFTFTVDFAIAVDCSIDQGSGTEDWQSCSASYAPAAPLADGTYAFRVRATDGIDETIVTRSFTVDTTRPMLSIDSGPPALTNGRTPIMFATDGRAQCSVDPGTPYAPCTSPYALTSLADGTYTFHVFAADDAGNTTTEQTWGPFTVDATPPRADVTSGPEGPTNVTMPSFGFTADPDATSFECSIDRGTTRYVSCPSSPYTPSGPLADGDYTFRVRATDGAGNVGIAATRRFSVDQDAPNLTIDSGPEGPTNVTTPSFGFTTDGDASTKCSLDQGTADWNDCSATYAQVTPLAEGRYTFRVRATDGVGNHADQSQSFTVDTTPPTLSISFGPSGSTSDSTPLFGFAAEAGATVQCSIDQGTPVYGSCASATTDAAIAPLADGAYVFRVLATDRAGNQTVATRAFTVTTGVGSPRTDPTPPAALRLLSPFPLVRISGTLTSHGAHIRLLTVRAPRGALVRITVRPACAGKRRSSRRCRVLHVSGTMGRRAVLGFRGLARTYPSGTVIVVLVWRADRIGKYTRFTIVRGKAPRRVDQCLRPGATRGSRCPSD
jgi:hypothetical protein